MCNLFQVVNKNLNPHWEPFTISVSEAGGVDAQLVWECFDYDSDGIGSFHASLRDLEGQKR